MSLGLFPSTLSANVGTTDAIAIPQFTADDAISDATDANNSDPALEDDGVDVSWASRSVVRIRLDAASASDISFRIWVLWEGQTTLWDLIDGGSGTMTAGDTTWSTIIDSSPISRVFIQFTNAGLLGASATPEVGPCMLR